MITRGSTPPPPMAGAAFATDEAVRDFCRKQREWLELEVRAEEDEQSQQATPSKGGRQSGGVDRTDASSSTSVVLRNLQVSGVSVGLYGRTVLHLEPAATSASARLPAHRYTTGDEVVLVRSSVTTSSSSVLEGVICEVSDDALAIALFGGGSGGGKKAAASNKRGGSQSDDYDFQPDDWPPPLSLRPRHSRDVHHKLLKALEQLEKHGLNDPHAKIVRALFEPKLEEVQPVAAPEPPSAAAAEALIDPNLNESQRQAVVAALDEASSPVTLVHGPPGTGKTTTLVEVIRQAVLRKRWKVLVAAPSNVAVDAVLAKLATPLPSATTTKPLASKRKSSSSSRRGGAPAALRLVRLGHPARLNPDILPFSLEAQVQAADGTQIVADVRKELQNLWSSSSSSFASRDDRRRHVRAEAAKLRKEIRDRESKVVRELLSNADVVLATCVGAASRLIDIIGDDKAGAPAAALFDLVVVDEAAQSLEAASWIPALRCKTKLVLAGDHKQLPPTIKSPALLSQLGRTMFERVHDLRPLDARLLAVQYRMNHAISDWASAAMYDRRLNAHETVRHHTLADLSTTRPHGSLSDRESELESGLGPLVWIDTAGCDLHESTASSGSKSNAGEAELVVAHTGRLLRAGVAPYQIAVITPYRGQVDLVRAALAKAAPTLPALDVRSVDGFQGGEREAIIISLVRSHPPQHQQRHGKSDTSIGFLRDDRRLNVAVTRSRRHCCVVGDSDTVRQSPFIRSLLEWVDEHGERLSAWNYGAEADNDAGILKAPPLRGFRKKPPPPRSEEEAAESYERQRALVEEIRSFAASARPGDTLRLPADLTRHDRRRVHEEAESLSLLHSSEGTEGLDRRLTLAMPSPSAAVAVVDSTPVLSLDTHSPAREDASRTELEPVTPAVSAVQRTGDAPAFVVSVVPPDETITAVTGEDRTAADTPFVALVVPQDDASDSRTDDYGTKAQPTPSFHALVEMDSSDVSEGQDDDESAAPRALALEILDPPEMNSCLAELARERAQRAQAARQVARKEAPAAASLRRNPTTHPPQQGRKLGGAKKNKKKPEPHPAAAADDSDAALDDMAFLDAQIHKNQTAHGRKLEGKGGYRTVLNGILTATPASASQSTAKRRDPKAVAALQAKVRQSENDRKAKSQPKKR